MPIWDRVNALSASDAELVKTWLQAHNGCSLQELTAYVDSL